MGVSLMFSLASRPIEKSTPKFRGEEEEKELIEEEEEENIFLKEKKKVQKECDEQEKDR